MNYEIFARITASSDIALAGGGGVLPPPQTIHGLNVVVFVIVRSFVLFLNDIFLYFSFPHDQLFLLNWNGV
jgi:hypothetical protein